MAQEQKDKKEQLASDLAGLICVLEDQLMDAPRLKRSKEKYNLILAAVIDKPKGGAIEEAVSTTHALSLVLVQVLAARGKKKVTV